MAKNGSTLADPAGEFDDWLELADLSDQAIGYLIIWADEDSDQEGPHETFKLPSGGETITLVGSDANGNLLLDTLTDSELDEDISCGRASDGEANSELTSKPWNDERTQGLGLCAFLFVRAQMNRFCWTGHPGSVSIALL